MSSRHSRPDNPLSSRVTTSPTDHALHHLQALRREIDAPHLVLGKCLERQRYPTLQRVEHHFGVSTYLVLGVLVRTQAQEVHEVVKIDLPIPLRVES